VSSGIDFPLSSHFTLLLLDDKYLSAPIALSDYYFILYVLSYFNLTVRQKRLSILVTIFQMKGLMYSNLLTMAPIFKEGSSFGLTSTQLWGSCSVCPLSSFTGCVWKGATHFMGLHRIACIFSMCVPMLTGMWGSCWVSCSDCILGS
jgi:hypothetical protein